MVEIKFCEHNMAQVEQEMVNKLKDNFNNVSIQIDPCLGHCGACEDGPFALVNDQLVQADTSDRLYKKITALL